MANKPKYNRGKKDRSRKPLPHETQPQTFELDTASELTSTHLITQSPGEKITNSKLSVNQFSTTKTNSLSVKLSRLLIIAPVLIPVTILLFTGLRGIDFGRHWDENYHIAEISGSVQKHILLPDGLYDYPSMCYWLEVLGIIPTIIRSVQLFGTDTALIQQRVLEGIQSHTYLLRMRSIFQIVSSLTLVWSYILVLVWRKSWVEAFIASCLLGGSWEFAYHSRWLAPDIIMTQFGFLAMLFVLLTQLGSNKRLWLRCAAVSAGLACATKYPAGLLIIPVLVAAFFLWDTSSSKRNLAFLMIETCIIFGISYLVITPGTILQPREFYTGFYIHDVVWYGDSQLGATVGPGIPHFTRLLSYFSIVLLSPYSYTALFMFIAALVGAYFLYKESSKMALLFLCFPIIYIVYFSLQRVMFVRNILIVTPFFAVLSARGIIIIWNSIKFQTLRFGYGALIALLLILNSYWLYSTSQTIVERESHQFIGDLAIYIDARPDIPFWLSSSVNQELLAYDGKKRTNVVTQINPFIHTVVFHAFEGFSYTTLGNDPALVTTWFGPWEVNFNYYPYWVGSDNIIVMPHTKAIEAHIKIIEQQ